MFAHQRRLIRDGEDDQVRVVPKPSRPIPVTDRHGRMARLGQLQTWGEVGPHNNVDRRRRRGWHLSVHRVQG